MRIFLILLLTCFTLEVSPKKYYVNNRTKVNWYIAFQDCLTRGQQLATITSEDEQKNLENALAKAIIKQNGLWISGTDNADEGQFVWMSTGHAVTYVKWASGEPNNQNNSENCVQVQVLDDPNNAEWLDKNCFDKAYYVCEAKHK